MATGQWTTGSLPTGIRAEAARAMLSQVHLPWSLRLRDRDAYECRLDWQDLGGCTVIECRSAPLAGHRGQSEIRNTAGDYVGLLLVLSGREHVRQGEINVALGPGDMLLWDAARPLDFSVSDRLHKVTLLIPRERMVRASASGRIGGARSLNGRTGLGALVAGHVAALGRVGNDIPAGDRPLATDLVVDLLGRLISPAEEPVREHELETRALRHVESFLDDPDLSPSAIAEALGVSARYLHMVFSRSGRTLSAHIRERRLARIRRDLADPRMARLSITEISLRWGFADSAHASRSFRRAYGMSPSQFRASAG